MSELSPAGDDNKSKAEVRKGLPVRTQARRAALQALYQWVMNPSSLVEIEQQFLADPSIQLGSKTFFSSLLTGVLSHVETIDATIETALDRPMSQLNPVELSALRLGVWELSQMPETPYRVVINEAVELAKAFGSEGGHAYVNGVLDKLAQTLRQEEAKA
jgi:transcription antitermination protein NusB